MTNIEGREQNCDACSAVAMCATHRGGDWLCYDCWHAARQREVPYHVVRDVTVKDNDGASRHYKLRCGENRACRAVVYLFEEAERRAGEMNAEVEKRNSFWVAYAAEKERPGWQAPTPQPADWHPEVAPSWDGERISHPGYMAKRRAAVLSEHPEYATRPPPDR